MQRHQRLGAIVVTTAVLSAGILPALPADADPPAPTHASTIAADWLAGQLTDGLVKNSAGAADYGASIDAALALKAAGKDAAAQKASSAVVAASTAYTEYDAAYSNGRYVGMYAGHVAKLLALELTVPPSSPPTCKNYTPPAAGVAETPPPSTPVAQGICELEERLLATADGATGRVQDTYSVTYNGADVATDPTHTTGAVANGFGIPTDPQHITQAGQAAAAYALSKLTALDDPAAAADLAAKAPKVVSFLLGEQSAAGGFCVEQTTGACTAPDAPTTAQVILQLQQLPATDPNASAITSSITRARAWLATQQRADGSFGDAVATGVSGAALAGTQNAQLAAVWLRQNQADELAACPDQLSGQTGAVALTVQARNSGRAGGIATAALGDWERATAASLSALTSLPAKPAAAAQLIGPSGFRKAGAVMTYDVANEAPGDLVCITGPNGILTRGFADSNGHASLDITMPSTTGDYRFTLHDHTGTDQSVVTRVLGPTRYSLSMVSHRQRGHLFRIRVFGLQSNENYYVKFRTGRIASGRAPSSGTVTVAYTIRRKAKLGKAKVTVVGQTGDRYGIRYIRVTR